MWFNTIYYPKWNQKLELVYTERKLPRKWCILYFSFYQSKKEIISRMIFFLRKWNPHNIKLTILKLTTEQHLIYSWYSTAMLSSKPYPLPLNETSYPFSILPFSSTLCVHARSPQSCSTLCNLCAVAHQVSVSTGFSRQEYWSGLPCLPPGDLPEPGIEPRSPVSPALKVDSYCWATREAPSSTLVLANINLLSVLWI